MLPNILSVERRKDPKVGNGSDGELQRFVHEHLTAAAVMVELAPAISTDQSGRQVRTYLERKDFDLAMVDSERLTVVLRSEMRALSRAALGKPVTELAEAPRRDRLIDRTLPIRSVVDKLLESTDPLLVVGPLGATHIVTRADFGGVAGTAVVLAYLLQVDQAANNLLRGMWDIAEGAIDPRHLQQAKSRMRKARREGAALEVGDYLSMGVRFNAIHALDLHRRFRLGNKRDHSRLVRIRNSAAHTLGDPDGALRAVKDAELLLDRFARIPLSLGTI